MSIKIGNIVKYKTRHLVQPTDNDLVVHVRLGDFINFEQHTSQIFDPDCIKTIIKQIQYDKLYIVCDGPNKANPWEQMYLDRFQDLNPVFMSGVLGDDFDFLLKAKKLVTSASSMSWMAALLGNADETHIPYNTYYGGFTSINQSLAECSSTSKVYYDMKYWFPIEATSPSQHEPIEAQPQPVNLLQYKQGSN